MGLFFRREDDQDECGKVIDLTDGERIMIRAFCPQCLDDARDVAEAVTGCETVIVNFTMTDRLTSRRIIDYVSGAAFTMGAEINRVAVGTFIITPRGTSFRGSLDEYAYDDGGEELEAAPDAVNGEDAEKLG